jgi:protein subunit release factor B
MVKKEKEEQLKKRMDELGIFDEDLIEKFILGSGKGGQKVNKSSTCVYLKHLPTGLEVKCQMDRSREMNRFLARRELCDKLEAIINKEASKKIQEAEKIRRQKKRRSRKQKEKMVDEKKRRGGVKKLRKIDHDS